MLAVCLEAKSTKADSRERSPGKKAQKAQRLGRSQGLDYHICIQPKTLRVVGSRVGSPDRWPSSFETKPRGGIAYRPASRARTARNIMNIMTV